MNTKSLSLWVTAITILTNLVLFYIGAPQTLTCSIAAMFGQSAYATSSN